MTKQHRAKPEVWATVERWCKNGMGAQNCLLELRARVEALEAAAKPAESNDPAGPDRSLVGRVANAIYSNPTSGVHEEARAAILAVADWLDQQELHNAATRLRQEVGVIQRPRLSR